MKDETTTEVKTKKQGSEYETRDAVSFDDGNDKMLALL